MSTLFICDSFDDWIHCIIGVHLDSFYFIAFLLKPLIKSYHISAKTDSTKRVAQYTRNLE